MWYFYMIELTCLICDWKLEFWKLGLWLLGGNCNRKLMTSSFRVILGPRTQDKFGKEADIQDHVTFLALFYLQLGEFHCSVASYLG